MGSSNSFSRKSSKPCPFSQSFLVLVDTAVFFLFNDVPPSIHLLHSDNCLIFVVLPLVVDNWLPVLRINLVIECYP